MTYLEWAQRFAELAFPWADPTYADRFQHLLQRIEARVNDTDSGEFTSKLFVADGVSAEEAAAADLLTHDDILSDPAPALEKLALAYPQTAELKVVPADVAWFPVLVREYPKPMPFVPVIDNDLLRWWGQDQLWQSEDQRYSADSVRAIPGPISVAGITTIDEPIADILGRFETAAIKRVQDEQQAADAAENDDFAALGEATSAEDFIRKSPNISWVGHITDNPAYGTAWATSTTRSARLTPRPASTIWTSTSTPTGTTTRTAAPPSTPCAISSSRSSWKAPSPAVCRSWTANA
mgnify:FL=1